MIHDLQTSWLRTKQKLFISFLLVFFGITVSSAQVTNEGKPISWKKELNSAKMLEMPTFNLKALKAEDSINDLRKDKPYRFGYEHQVNIGFDQGKWNELDNGDRVWLLNVKSEGAKTLNFLFDEFNIPKGAKLYFYSNDKTDLLGAYTSSQNREDMKFGSWLINGDNIWIEYYEPKNADFRGQLNISEVIHGYRSVKDITDLSSKALGDSGDCNQDVDCLIGSDFDDYKDELKKSVAMVVVGGSGFCSGTLINNTSNDKSQYFLTANHCLSGSVGSWAFRFGWKSPEPSCSTTDSSPDGDYNQTASGASLLASNSRSDFALLEIDAPLSDDWDLVWAGWDRSEDIPDYTVGIHHPRGDIMKVCRDDDSPSMNTRTFQGVDMENWFLDEWELGVTEPGSSGSALFDQNGRIVGQLAGGAAACSGTNNNGAYDFYGRFGVSWDYGNSSSSRLSDWLDPLGSGAMILDQYPPLQVLDNNVTLLVENVNGAICGNEVSPLFKIYNRGEQNVTSATLTYKQGNEPEQTIEWTGNLANGEIDEIGSVVLDLELGTNLEATLLINGVEDEFMDDNSIVKVIDNYQDMSFATNSITLTLKTDDYAEETSWEFIDEDGNVIQESQPNLENDTVYTETFEVNPDSCYSFIIYDSYGDGICCSYGEGYYKLETDSEVLIYEGGEYGPNEETNFKVLSTLSTSVFKDSSVSIYPNPTNSVINIQTDISNDLKVSLYDITGKKLYEGTMVNESIINLSKFANGVYFVKIDNENQSITKKVVKQ